MVTGGSGRVGSYIVRELAAAGHEVTVIDRVPPAEGVRWIKADTEDFGEMIGALQGADAVAHTAAVSLPGTAPNNVLFHTNVIGNYNVHEAAALLGIRRVVMTSSSAITGFTYRERDFIPQYLPIDEDQPLAPQDPYGVGKLCEEQIAQSFTRRRGMETVALRLARVLTPEMSVAFRAEGGHRPTRFDPCSYVDARDVAVAFRKALELPSVEHEALYVVADDSSCAEPLCEVLPRVAPEIGRMADCLTGERPGISNARAKQLLGWEPKHSWRRG